MSYLVLARKCRPTCFDEVVGQSHITKTLANAISLDRVAHGFLFSGVRGVGKTSLARILAKSLNCVQGPTAIPCNVCESCKTITNGTAVDVIEIDGASNNSVDDIRSLRETVPYRPIIGRYKVYVIDEVHMLSVSAFNALLKTLEEPPGHVKFIFATTEPHKIPSTILSRIQRYDFRRISSVAIIERIKQVLVQEGIEVEDAALAIVGREADGSMRDALSVLDQVLAGGEKSITAEYVAQLLGVVGRTVYYDLCNAMLSRDPKTCIEIIRQVDKQGYDIAVFSRGLIEHLRNLIVTSICGNEVSFLELPSEEIDNLKKQSQMVKRDTLHRAFKHISDAYEEIARSSFPKILLEATIARLADFDEPVPASFLIGRLEALAKGGGVSPGTLNSANMNAAPVMTASSKRQETQRQETASKNDLHKEQLSAEAIKKNTKIVSKQSFFTQNAEEPISKAKWESLLLKLSEQIPYKSSVLERATLEENSTISSITLFFDVNDTFACEVIKEGTLKREIEESLLKITGHKVMLRVEIKDLGEKSSVAQKKLQIQEDKRKKEDAALAHPVVKKLGAAFSSTPSILKIIEKTN